MLIRSLFMLGCLCAAGCGESSPSMRMWGTVSYQGQLIPEGQIILFPIDGTAGPSTGGIIQNGQYEIAKRRGPYAGGTYRVEITGFGAEKVYSPNATSKGSGIRVREQIVAVQFNQQSNLRIEVSKSASENQRDFTLE